jgi:hypothetical protein
MENIIKTVNLRNGRKFSQAVDGMCLLNDGRCQRKIGAVSAATCKGMTFIVVGCYCWFFSFKKRNAARSSSSRQIRD